MDSESSTKFIGSLTKFLQSLCNGYVDFDDGVELIGHIYLSVDAGKSGKTLNYFLNEKVCKNDNSVTFISNSFHAQPEAKSKTPSGKEDGKKDDGDFSDSGDNIPKSTNAGTISSRPQMSSHSAASPNQSRTGVHVGTKRPGSPLKGPIPAQRRPPTPPSQRRIQSSASRGAVGSPVSKTVPSSPSSSSQDNVPSPARKNRNEISQPASNQSDQVSADNESDIVPPNVLQSINPTPEFASFLGSLTSDNQTSQDQPSPPDTKPDTDVTFIKEEFVSEPSSCAQTGSSGQHSGRSGEDNSGLYPVMLHQNTSVFPSTSAGYPPAYQGGASATATSQHPGFPGSSTSQSDPFNPVPGTSQDGADPSGCTTSRQTQSPYGRTVGSKSQAHVACDHCGTEFSNLEELTQHIQLWHSDLVGHLPQAGHTSESRRALRRKNPGSAALRVSKKSDVEVGLDSSHLAEDLPVSFLGTYKEGRVNSSGKSKSTSRQSGDAGITGCAVVEAGEHSCPVCHKTFRYNFNLRRHLNTHTAYFQHRCFICGRGFHRSDFMQRHVRTVHKNIVGTDIA